MIGKLRGIIDTIYEDQLILDVAGVGYTIFCSAKTLNHLPAATHTASLLIETHVREDHIHLYGFASHEERQWFRTLTTVQGVGVRMALAILSVFTPKELITIIAAQDKKTLTEVSGVGPKLAERLVVELKSPVSKMTLGLAHDSIETSGGTAFAGTAKSSKTSSKTSVVEDAVSALSHLGYSRMEAFGAVSRIASSIPDASIDELIKRALRELAI